MQNYKNITNKFDIDDLVFVLLLLSALWDTLSGIFLQYLNFSAFSLIVKSLLLVVLLFRLPKENHGFYFLFIAFICLSAFSGYVRYGLIDTSVDWLIKSMSIVAFYDFFLYYFRKNTGKLYVVEVRTFYLLGISFFIYCFNILLGVLGFGKVQYTFGEDVNIGGIGFIYAGNEMSIAMLVVFVMILQSLYYKPRYFSFLTYAFALPAFFLKATKTALVGFLIFLMLSELRKSKRATIIFAVVFALFFPYLYDQWLGLGILDRFEYAVYHDGLISAITSTRSSWSLAVSSYFFSGSTINLILGIGSVGIYDIIGKPSIEMDFFDFLYSVGFVGLVFSHSIFIKLLHSTKLDFYAGCIVVFIFIVSMLAGHVLNGGIVAPYLALLFAIFKYTYSRKL